MLPVEARGSSSFRERTGRSWFAPRPSSQSSPISVAVLPDFGWRREPRPADRRDHAAATGAAGVDARTEGDRGDDHRADRQHRRCCASACSSEECPDVAVYRQSRVPEPRGLSQGSPALRMIEDGERSGRLTRGRTILDSTSGNTGIAYAMIGAAKGYRVRLGDARQRQRRAPPAGDRVRRRGRVQRSARRAATARSAWFVPCMRKTRTRISCPTSTTTTPTGSPTTTGPGMEIWEQTRGTVTHFVAALGTSGTFMGVTRRLKEMNPDVRCISVQPAEPWHGLEGLKHMETSIVPGIYDAVARRRGHRCRDRARLRPRAGAGTHRGHPRRALERCGALGVRRDRAADRARGDRHRAARWR